MRVRGVYRVLLVLGCITTCFGFVPPSRVANLARIRLGRRCMQRAMQPLPVSGIQPPQMLKWLQDWSQRSAPNPSNNDVGASVAGLPKTYLPTLCVNEEDGVLFKYMGAKGCTLKLKVDVQGNTDSLVQVVPSIPSDTARDVARFVEASNNAIVEKLQQDIHKFSEITALFKPRQAAERSPHSGTIPADVLRLPTPLTPRLQQQNHLPNPLAEITTMEPKQLAQQVGAFAGWLKKQGFANALQAAQNKKYTSDSESFPPSGDTYPPPLAGKSQGLDVTRDVNTTKQLLEDPDLRTLFERGSKLAEERWREVAFSGQENDGVMELAIPVDTAEPRAQDEEEIDIFAGPQAFAKLTQATSEQRYPVLQGGLSDAHLHSNHTVAPEPKELEADKMRMLELFSQLANTTDDRHDHVLQHYPELMLSDNIFYLLTTVNRTVTDPAARRLFSKIAFRAYDVRQQYKKEVREAEMEHLRLFQVICRSALGTEERFLDAMQYLRSDLTPEFLSYLAFAISQEEAKLKQQGRDLIPEATVWLNLMRLVHKGCCAEVAKRIDYEGQALALILRYSNRTIRFELLKEVVKGMGELELPRFRFTADRLIGNVLREGPSCLLEPAMYPRIKDLKEDLDRVLPYSLIDDKLTALLQSQIAKGHDISKALLALARDGAISPGLLYDKIVKHQGRPEEFSSFI